MIKRLVDLGGRSPFAVLGVAFVLMIGAWGYASRLELRSDFLELVPRDSAGFRAFEHQLLADNQALQSFGRLAMVGEIACLYGALFFLPSLLHIWRARATRVIG